MCLSTISRSSTRLSRRTFPRHYGSGADRFHMGHCTLLKRAACFATVLQQSQGRSLWLVNRPGRSPHGHCTRVDGGPCDFTHTQTESTMIYQSLPLVA
jgi:hypothetical protein